MAEAMNNTQDLGIEKLLTVEQARGILNVSRKTLYELLSEGEITGVLIRGSRRFTVSEIAECIARGQQRARDERDSKTTPKSP